MVYVSCWWTPTHQPTRTAVKGERDGRSPTCPLFVQLSTESTDRNIEYGLCVLLMSTPTPGLQPRRKGAKSCPPLSSSDQANPFQSLKMFLYFTHRRIYAGYRRIPISSADTSDFAPPPHPQEILDPPLSVDYFCLPNWLTLWWTAWKTHQMYLKCVVEFTFSMSCFSTNYAPTPFQLAAVLLTTSHVSLTPRPVQ